MDDFDRGGYDLVLFHIEQAIQLYAKYLLYRRLGDFPKTHSIVILLKDLVKIYGNKELENIVSSHIELLYLLEELYIMSKYIPREYDPEIVTRALELGKKLLEVFKWLEKAS
ncbi:MAG: HEPN domain-containing protein [Desulfurococcaceae archaeon]